jgi:predicted acylesterase/phospholipase RssA
MDMQDNAVFRSGKGFGGSLPGQVVLVLQGGGALGSYQAGVYQALHEAGIEPDWIIGTSIGAINASLIAGNEPEHRLPRLREFWKRMQQNPDNQLLAPSTTGRRCSQSRAGCSRHCAGYSRRGLPTTA